METLAWSISGILLLLGWTVGVASFFYGLGGRDEAYRNLAKLRQEPRDGR